MTRTSRAWLCLFVFLPLILATVPTPRAVGEVRIGPDLRVVEAVFGVVDPNTNEIVASDRIDTSKHAAFGWRVRLEGTQRTVRYREEFVLPAPAQIWQVGPQTTVAHDRASAVTNAAFPLDRSMLVQNGWIHTPGDPRGNHVIRVWLDDVLVREFDFVLY